MKHLYIEAKRGVYKGTSVAFLVILFGALGAGFFFFLQNILHLHHVLGATEAVNEPTLWFILFWATDFFFVIMAVATAYAIAGPSTLAPVAALSVYFAHFTQPSVAGAQMYVAYFATPYGYADSTSIGYMGYLIMAVLCALLIRLFNIAWHNFKAPLGRFFDRVFAALRKKISAIPETLKGYEIAEALDLFILFLLMPVIACALTFLFTKYAIQVPFGALGGVLGKALAALVSKHLLLAALVIGCMVGFDLFGPVSMAAYAVCTAAYLDAGNAQLITIYGACFVTVGWTAFFGVLWCRMFKKGKTDTEDFNMATSGPINAFFENLKLTVAFAMPIAARSPFAYIPGYMVGSALTGFFAALFRIVNTAYIDGSLPKYTSAFHAYGGVDQTYQMLFRRGELFLSFSLPLRSGDWWTCRIPLFFLILLCGAVGGFVVLGLRSLQVKFLAKRGIEYDFATDMTLVLRAKAKRFAARFHAKAQDAEETAEDNEDTVAATNL